MYDTVGFSLKANHAPGIDFMRVTPRFFDASGEHVYNNGASSISGYLDCLKVSATEANLKITEGSLCKWFLGDNFQTLTETHTKQAIEKLSDILHLPFDKADITRLDYGQNMITKYPPEVYLNHLGKLNYYSRLPQPNGLYYQNNKRQLIFYNKIKEQRIKGESIPDLYKGENVLRYEQRHKKWLKADLNKERITGSDLYDCKFYKQVGDSLRKSYAAIQKVNQLQIDYSKITKTSQLSSSSIAYTVSQHGGELAYCEGIVEAFKKGELTKKQAHDLTKAVKEACKSKLNTKRSELADELDTLILGVACLEE